MSNLEAVDTKAGYTSLCRTGSHVLCASARCTCGCHPTRRTTAEPPDGSWPHPKPPLPADDDEPEIPELPDSRHANHTPPRDIPHTQEAAVPTTTAPHETTNGQVYACPDCDTVFNTPQGRGAHRARSHGYRTANTDADRKAKDRERKRRERSPQRADPPRRQVQRQATERMARAAVAAEAFDRTLDLPIDQLVARASVWLELGTVELRAITTPDGRLRVLARFVPDDEPVEP